MNYRVTHSSPLPQRLSPLAKHLFTHLPKLGQLEMTSVDLENSCPVCTGCLVCPSNSRLVCCLYRMSHLSRHVLDPSEGRLILLTLGLPDLSYVTGDPVFQTPSPASRILLVRLSRQSDDTVTRKNLVQNYYMAHLLGSSVLIIFAENSVRLSTGDLTTGLTF